MVSSQSSVFVGMGSDAVRFAELTRIVEVVGGSGSPKGMGGGKSVTVGSCGSAVTVTVGSDALGVAVITTVVVVEPSTMSIVATTTPTEGVAVTVVVGAIV